MSFNNILLAKNPVLQGFLEQNQFKFHRVCCTQDLPSNSCIGRAPQDVPNLPASLERGASDTTLAFLDNFRLADNYRQSARTLVGRLPQSGCDLGAERRESSTCPALPTAASFLHFLASGHWL